MKNKGTKKTAKAPPKRFVVPPDLAPLKHYGKVLVNMMHYTYNKRMREMNRK